MSKKNKEKSRNEKSPSTILNLITAIINLIVALILLKVNT